VKVIWWCGLNRKAAPSRRAQQVTAASVAGEVGSGRVCHRHNHTVLTLRMKPRIGPLICFYPAAAFQTSALATRSDVVPQSPHHA